jgi:type IV secretion system protein VirD4
VGTLIRIFLGLFADISRLVSFLTGDKAGLYTARFAGLSELEALKGSETRAPALLLGEGRFGEILKVVQSPEYPELGNLMAVAPTRGGKGLLAVSQLLTWPGSAVVNDIKGDLYEQTAGARSRFSEIGVFDPSLGVGDRFDPSEGVFQEHKLYRLAKNLLFDPQEREAIFTERATKMLTQLFLAARETHELPFPYIARLINNGLNSVAREIQRVDPLLTRKLLDAEFEEGRDFETDRFRSSAWATLSSRLYSLLTPEILRCLSAADFHIRDLLFGKKPVTIYFRWHESDLFSLSPLIKFVWECMVNELTEAFDRNSGQGSHLVLFLIDEAGRTGIPNLPEHASTVNSRGMSFWIAFQDLSQADALYGRLRAESLRNNCDTQLFYRQASQETAEYVQRKLDYTSGFAHSATTLQGAPRTEAQSEQAVPLMAAHEIRQMARDRVIGFHRDLPPLRARRMDWRRFPGLARGRSLEAPKLSPLPPLPEEKGSGREKKPPSAPEWRINPDLFRTRIRPDQHT